MIFDQVRSAGAEVPALYGALAHAPRVLKGWTKLAWSLRFAATTPRSLRELVILRVAFRLESDYEWEHHVEMGIEAGLSPVEIDAARDQGAVADLGDRERACIALVDEMIDGRSVSDATYAECAALLDETELIEVIVTAAFYGCVSQVLDALGIGRDEPAADAPSVDA